MHTKQYSELSQQAKHTLPFPSNSFVFSVIESSRRFSTKLFFRVKVSFGLVALRNSELAHVFPSVLHSTAQVATEILMPHLTLTFPSFKYFTKMVIVRLQNYYMLTGVIGVQSKSKVSIPLCQTSQRPYPWTRELRATSSHDIHLPEACLTKSRCMNWWLSKKAMPSQTS